MKNHKYSTTQRVSGPPPATSAPEMVPAASTQPDRAESTTNPWMEPAKMAASPPFEDRMVQLRGFVEREGRLPRSQAGDDEERRLGKWLNNQRSKLDTLPRAQLDALRSVPRHFGVQRPPGQAP